MLRPGFPVRSVFVVDQGGKVLFAKASEIGEVPEVDEVPNALSV